MCGQRQEPRLLLRQDLGHRLVALLGMQPLMGDVVPPARTLRIEVVDIAKGPGGEEGVAEVADLALDFPFFIAAGGGARPDGEMIVPREVQQAGVKTDRRALTLEYGTFQVVVLLCPRLICGGARRSERSAPVDRVEPGT